MTEAKKTPNPYKVKYIGGGPVPLVINGEPVAPDTIVTLTRATIAKLCTRKDCEPVYDEPETDAQVAAVVERRKAEIEEAKKKYGVGGGEGDAEGGA